MAKVQKNNPKNVKAVVAALKEALTEAESWEAHVYRGIRDAGPNDPEFDPAMFNAGFIQKAPSREVSITFSILQPVRKRQKA